MNVFEAVKGKVTARQAAEMYGVRVNRHGMAVCPFHNENGKCLKAPYSVFSVAGFSAPADCCSALAETSFSP